MANIRLFGLVLVITALIMGLAAVTTQTTIIRLGDTGIFGDLEKFDIGNYDKQNQNTSWKIQQAEPAVDVKFITIPVAYPLLAACCFGLILWFLPELGHRKKPVQFGTNRRRRRR